MRLALFLSLLPLLAAIIIKKLGSSPSSGILTGKHAQIPLDTLCKTLLPATPLEFSGDQIQVKGNQLHLPASQASSTTLSTHAQALPLIGLFLLAKGKPHWADRHKALLRFDQLFTVFSLLTILLGSLARAIPPYFALTLAISTLGIVACNSLYLTWIRRHAILLALQKLRTIPLYTKSGDFTVLEQALKGEIYRHTLPKALALLSR